jgi:hypothetical protein
MIVQRAAPLDGPKVMVPTAYVQTNRITSYRRHPCQVKIVIQMVKSNAAHIDPDLMR